jgi:ribonuclease HII
MDHYAQLYPVYNFGQNKGYATKEHRNSIQKNGRCPVHRRSFRCADL